jgi:diguanylate cyclase (GGDEF)-like protein
MLLRPKLMLIHGAVAVAATAMSLLAYAGVRAVGVEYERISRQHLPAVALLHDLRAAGLDAAASAGGIVLDAGIAAGPGAAGEGFRAAGAAYAAAAGAYLDRAGRDGPEELGRARALDAAGREVLAAGADLVGRAAGGGPGPALADARRRLEDAERRFRAGTGEALARGREEVAAFDRGIRFAIAASDRNVLIAAGVTLIVVTSAGLVTARTIVGPIRHLTLATSRVAAGEPVELEVPGSRDEIASLVQAFRRMADDLAGSRARVRHQALHDGLTGLPNRLLLQERLGQALAHARRGGTGAAGGGAVAVLCLDLDRFKPVNDTLGHAVGDALLCAAAERLRGHVREEDTVARLGGDEFAILQAGVAQPEGAGALARRLVEALGQPFEVDGHQLVVGASVGIALAPGDGADPDDLLKKADMALYRAKADGRGTFRSFEPGMDAKLHARRLLELDLRKALASGGFELHYQPLVDLRTGAIAAFEALLRWPHPSRGMVPPAEFVPLAEEVGLIVPLGEWVLHRACEDAAGWPGEVRVAVNLSAVQFRGDALVPSVVAALAASGLPAERLELEITEGVLLQDGEATLATLRDLRALGVRVAMDDFGTGYSSLGYLRSFPFDKIKIDRSFVGELGASPDCEAIVRAVTGLGGSLGIATTAEGVETAEQLERLRAEGCDEAQGYHLGRPMPAREAALLLGAAPPAAGPGPDRREADPRPAATA